MYMFVLYRDSDRSDFLQICLDVESAVHFIKTDTSVKSVTYKKIQIFEDDKETYVGYEIRVARANFVVDDVENYVLVREEVYEQK
jgi:hypothetical protein